MSYIAFDLSALEAAPNVARAARVPEDTIVAGLARLWAHAFRRKTAVLADLEVRGCFNAEADVVPALTAFGFLAPDPAGLRIKGADRYLRIADARSKGGKAAAGNLKRGSSRAEALPELPPGSPPAEAGTQPGDTPGSFPALTSSIEHRTSNIIKDRAPTAKRVRRLPIVAVNEEPVVEPLELVGEELPPEGPRQKASDVLSADFEAVTGQRYLWQGAKDGTALAALLKAFPLEEVRARWRRGLEAPATTWASCRNVATLRAKWNDLGDAGKRDVTRGVAEPSDWAGRETREVTL